MKPVATIVLASVGFMATAAQAFFAWAWMQADVKKQFVSVFKGVYGEVPGWTAFMFGLGHLVWFLPAISAVLVFLGLRRSARPSLSVASAIVVVVLIGMVYAMYPIHIMMGVI